MPAVRGGDAPGATVGDAVEALRAGRPVVIPTDTVYGVAALLSAPGATHALFALKERSADQPLAVLVADAAQAVELATLEGVAERLALAFWPGPLTLVLRRQPDLVDRLALGGDRTTIGVRCPASPLVRALVAEVGPIATTSANRHGEATPATAAEAAAALAGPVAVVLDGGILDGRPSTVVDCTGDGWRPLRSGALSIHEIAALVGSPAS